MTTNEDSMRQRRLISSPPEELLPFSHTSLKEGESPNFTLMDQGDGKWSRCKSTWRPVLDETGSCDSSLLAGHKISVATLDWATPEHHWEVSHQFHYSGSPLSKKTFRVTVGKGSIQQEYRVLHDRMVQRSKFFEAARSTRWTRSDEATHLAEEDPWAFSDYLLYAYFGEVEQGRYRRQMIGLTNAIIRSKNHTTNGDAVPPDVQLMRDINFNRLIDIYLLSDMLADPVSANLVMDDLIHFGTETETVPTATGIDLAYSSTVRSSPLRKVIRDWYVHEASPEAVEAACQHDVHPEFLQEYVIEVANLKDKNVSRTIRKILFHKVVDRDRKEYHQQVT